MHYRDTSPLRVLQAPFRTWGEAFSIVQKHLLSPRCLVSYDIWFLRVHLWAPLCKACPIQYFQTKYCDKSFYIIISITQNWVTKTFTCHLYVCMIETFICEHLTFESTITVWKKKNCVRTLVNFTTAVIVTFLLLAWYCYFLPVFLTTIYNIKRCVTVLLIVWNSFSTANLL